MKEWSLKTIGKFILAVIITNFTTLFGSLDNAMATLTTFIVLDITSGCTRAFIQKRLSSNESFRGVARKVLIYIIVALSAQLDRLMTTDVIRNAVIAFYCVSESLSILENSVAAGLPVPNFLREVLQRINPDKLPQEENKDG